jgi:hypothetical protein
MSNATHRIDPATARRNRITVWILVGLMLGMAAWGNLYLRHFGFNTSKTSERYH